jgi:hypothetical protein
MYSLKVNATCKLLKVGTRSTLENILNLCHVSAFFESPRALIMRQEVLILLTALAYLFIGILGSQRRRSTSWFIQKGLLVTHTLSFPLGAYTLSSLQSHSTGESTMYTIWAVSLYILHSCTNTSYRHQTSNKVPLPVVPLLCKWHGAFDNPKWI